MTLRLYADRKSLPLGRVSVDVAHDKVHAADCVDCAADGLSNAKIDHFIRNIAVEAEVTDELRAKIIEIANKCPVHRTLESSSVVSTSVDTLKEPTLEGSRNGAQGSQATTRLSRTDRAK